MISIIITAYKEPRTIGKAIGQVLKNRIKEKYEILVLAPDDETLNEARKYINYFKKNKKIKLIDDVRIFVLPSKREAMPQALIEAMARRKVVISSATDGGKELVQADKTGLLFEIGNYKKLAELIRKNIAGNKAIQQSAAQESKKYAWSSLIKDYIKLFKLFNKK